MKVDITGLTELTIVFNHLKLVLRGMQTARGLKISTDTQKAEVLQLRNSGMINVVGLEEPKPLPKKTRKPRVAKTEAAVKTDSEKKSTKKAGPKAIKRADADVSPENLNDKSDVIVMTPGGAVKGKMKNSAMSAKEDESKIQPSLDAMEKLEDEEGAEVAPDLERDLDASEKMGGKATIATGSGTTKQVNLTNSILPDAEAMKKRDPFIDNDLSKVNDKDDTFVDKNDIADDKDEDLFIEV